ncbi:hypothetical protein QQ994_10110 [Pseudomonas asiatica]|uniref:hypothetical protein n=1 Tax=Pseudomonas asiatica TaxID=2219225 RepID=UPI00257029EB|nr:hypothetical protein [Pseudomonas asiatica]WJD72188.1 hypothetical protein QQ994_10110 [Pseudomonas asiatica]
MDYPFYLQLFTHHAAALETGMIGSTLLQWFLLPLAIAAVAHQLLSKLLSAARFEALLERVDRCVPWEVCVLVLEIFAANIAVILEHRGLFA